MRLLLAVAAVLALAAPAADARPRDPSLLQMNLCLSGVAGCFAGTQYPAVVDESITRIRETRADAVTLNEACSGDAERIARETGYDVRFATVIYNGAPLPCRNPEGRGVFGNAVLTRGRIVRSEDAAFAAQSGVEERRWLCVRTVQAARVCTAHLSTAGTPEQAAANEAQCAELRAILSRPLTAFGGDVNRRASCAPAGAFTATDAEAAQAPGIQHVYGTFPFSRPRTTILPMTYTDHDALLVSARSTPGR